MLQLPCPAIKHHCGRRIPSERRARCFGNLRQNRNFRIRSAQGPIEEREITQQIKEFLKEQGVKADQIKTSLLTMNVIEQSDAVYFGKGSRNLQQAPQQQAPPSEDPFSDSDNLPQQSSQERRGGDSTPEITYRAQRELIIHLTALDKYETIYCGLLVRGVQQPPIVELKNSNPQPHWDKARMDAARDARGKARVMAQALNASLTAVNTIVEQQSSSGRGGMGMYDPFGSNDPGNDASAGAVIYRVKVETVFKLSDASQGK